MQQLKEEEENRRWLNKEAREAPELSKVRTSEQEKTSRRVDLKPATAYRDRGWESDGWYSEQTGNKWNQALGNEAYGWNSRKRAMAYQPVSGESCDGNEDTMSLGRVEFYTEDWTPGPNKEGRFLNQSCSTPMPVASLHIILKNKFSRQLRNTTVRAGVLVVKLLARTSATVCSFICMIGSFERKIARRIRDWSYW